MVGRFSDRLGILIVSLSVGLGGLIAPPGVAETPPQAPQDEVQVPPSSPLKIAFLQRGAGYELTVEAARPLDNVTVEMAWPDELPLYDEWGQVRVAGRDSADVAPGRQFSQSARLGETDALTPGTHWVKATATYQEPGLSLFSDAYLRIERGPGPADRAVFPEQHGPLGPLPEPGSTPIVGKGGPGELPPGYAIPPEDEGSGDPASEGFGALAGGFGVQGRVVYDALFFAGMTGIPYVLVQVWDDDTQTNDDLIGSVCTDANGNYFLSGIDNTDGEGGTQDVYLVFKTGCANHVQFFYDTATCCGVTRSEYTFQSLSNRLLECTRTVQSNVPNGATVNFGQCAPPSADNYAWQVFDFAEASVELTLESGFNPGIVKLIAPQIGGLFDNSGAEYDPGSDEIHLSNPITQFSVGGGFDVVGHEYGHFIMDKAYGDDYPNTNCPSPHYIDQDSNQVCAWSEGWATYYAIIAMIESSRYSNRLGDAEYDSPSFNWDIELSQTAPGHGGDDAEGDVSATLWDTYDYYSFEPYDNIDGKSFGSVYSVFRDGTRDTKLSEFYSSWIAYPWPRREIVHTARQNDINYNVYLPTTTLVSPNNGGWLRGDVQITATGTDQDSDIGAIDFGFSVDNNGCSIDDEFFGSTFWYDAPPFVITWNSRTTEDRPLNRVWLCASARDWTGPSGTYDASNGPGFGIDNTQPTGTVTIPTVAGEFTASVFTASWSSNDAMSGISSGAVALVEQADGGATVQKCIGDATDSCQVIQPVPGSYCYFTRITDRAGNVGQSDQACTTIV